MKKYFWHLLGDERGIRAQEPQFFSLWSLKSHFCSSLGALCCKAWSPKNVCRRLGALLFGGPGALEYDFLGAGALHPFGTLSCICNFKMQLLKFCFRPFCSLNILYPQFTYGVHIIHSQPCTPFINFKSIIFS